jgi:spermidine synthase
MQSSLTGSINSGTMGAGHFVRLLQSKNAKSTVLEFDYQMGAQAKKHFDVEPTNAYYGDPVDHIKNKFTEKQFDWIFHDVFSTGNNPVHLLTRYNIKSLKHVLNDKGVLVLVRFAYRRCRSLPPRLM